MQGAYERHRFFTLPSEVVTDQVRCGAQESVFFKAPWLVLMWVVAGLT